MIDPFPAADNGAGNEINENKSSPAVSAVSAAWSRRAPELADWALCLLVNNAGAYVTYHPSRGQLTRRGVVNRTLLVRHYQAQTAADIIALHTADADNRSKGGGLDIDQHGAYDPVRAEVNRLAALHWHGELVRQGFRPLLTESNGRGGYHLRILLAEPIDAARIYHFLRRLTADHRTVEFDKPPEQFPKQADVRKCDKGLGNVLRLPGRHPKRPFWSRVWDGSRWLAGHDAIDFILCLKGDPPQLVPELATEPTEHSRGHGLKITAPACDERDDRALALEALAGLSAARAIGYDDWLAVGMALHSVDPSESMLAEWDRWSRLAPDKYTEGACAAKWATFNGAGGITLGSLIFSAKEDGWKPNRGESQDDTVPTASGPGQAAPPPPIAAEQLTRVVLDTLRADAALACVLRDILRDADTGTGTEKGDAIQCV